MLNDLNTNHKHTNKIYADGDNIFVFLSDNYEESMIYSFSNYIIGSLSMSASETIPNHQELNLSIFSENFELQHFNSKESDVDFEVKKVFKKVGFYKSKLKNKRK